MLATLSFEDRVKQYFSDYEAYLENQKSRLPCLNIESSQGKQTVEVFFDDSLVKKMLRKPKQFKKPVKALRYGYVGNRKGILDQLTSLGGVEFNIPNQVLRADPVSRKYDPLEVIGFFDSLSFVFFCISILFFVIRRGLNHENIMHMAFSESCGRNRIV